MEDNNMVLEIRSAMKGLIKGDKSVSMLNESKYNEAITDSDMILAFLEENKDKVLSGRYPGSVVEDVLSEYVTLNNLEYTQELVDLAREWLDNNGILAPNLSDVNESSIQEACKKQYESCVNSDKKLVEEEGEVMTVLDAVREYGVNFDTLVDGDNNYYSIVDLLDSVEDSSLLGKKVKVYNNGELLEVVNEEGSTTGDAYVMMKDSVDDLEEAELDEARKTPAAYLKQDIAKTFKGKYDKLTAKYKSYSGGDSATAVVVNFRGDLKELNALENKYMYGDFDGMQDMYVHKDKADRELPDEAQAKYVFIETPYTYEFAKPYFDKYMAEEFNMEDKYKFDLASDYRGMASIENLPGCEYGPRNPAVKAYTEWFQKQMEEGNIIKESVTGLEEATDVTNDIQVGWIVSYKDNDYKVVGREGDTLSLDDGSGEVIEVDFPALNEAEDYRSNKIKAEYVGEDDFNRALYKDEKDVTYAEDNDDGVLYSISKDWGELIQPVGVLELVGEGKPDPKEKFNYMMLGRLQGDCKYAKTSNSIRNLWGGTVDEHIAEMRKLWDGFADDRKPEWISKEEIDHCETMLKAIENGDDDINEAFEDKFLDSEWNEGGDKVTFSDWMKKEHISQEELEQATDEIYESKPGSFDLGHQIKTVS